MQVENRPRKILNRQTKARIIPTFMFMELHKKAEINDLLHVN